jgi:hypothetical protein
MKILVGVTALLMMATSSAFAQSRDPMTGQRDIASYDHNISNDDGGNGGGSGGGGGGSRGFSAGGPKVDLTKPDQVIRWLQQSYGMK